MKERTKFALLVGAFALAYFLPVEHQRFQSSLTEAFFMVKEYAQQHVLFCLVPAFFIAGAISCFVSQASVMKYFGAGANKILSYGVASVSGTILAVCSCTILPLFAGIHRRGAGLGPAIAFLYSGPAINVLAIILTARVLGWQLGAARAVAQTATYFATMVPILIFAAWGKPAQSVGFWDAVYRIHWPLTGAFAVALAVIIWKWFNKEELSDWVETTWGFAKQIMPLLFFGVLIAGLLLGRPGVDNGLIPAKYVAGVVGGNSLWANFFASVAGAFMYFATLTEVPIVQGLMGNGMGEGPALALLLAGPALSLPSMLVIRSVIGTQKTIVYCTLVVIMATISGIIYGSIVA
jgi:hypothetical protein